MVQTGANEIIEVKFQEVDQMEKVLRDNADKVDAAQKASVDGPLAELKTALTGNELLIT